VIFVLLAVACSPATRFAGGDGTTADTDTATDTAGDTPDTADTADTAGDSGVDTADTGTAHGGPQWTLYAVRHCEKDEEDASDDPGLTAEGTARAIVLAERLSEVPLGFIYATDLRRTQETVAPTAQDHGLPVEINIDPEAELAAYILQTHPGDTLLHAGHSYTLPALFLGLTAEGLTVDGYGQLWILTGDAGGTLSVVTEHFGEP